MNKFTLLFLLLIVLLLTACDDGAQPYNPADPVSIAGAQSILNAATQVAVSTQSARIENERQATLQAAREKSASEAKIAVIEKEMQATRQAFDLQIAAGQATALVENVRKTETAYQASVGQTQAAEYRTTATAGALTATPQYATQVALVNAITLEQKRVKQQEVSMWIWAIATPVALLILVYGLVKIGLRLLEWYIEWRDRAERIFDTRGGVVIFNYNPELNVYDPELLIPRYQDMNKRALGPGDARLADRTVRLTQSGSVLSSPTDASVKESPIALAHRLVQTASRINGGDSNQIPRWDKAGWGSKIWQRAKNYLEKRGYVISEEGQGTYVVDGTLDDLIYRLETEDVKLR